VAGIRSLFLVTIAALAVALPQQGGRQPFSFDMVDVGEGLWVMRHEVTIAEWRRCAVEGACSYQPKPGSGAEGEDYPVTGVGALDVEEFVAWARKASGKELRLPTVDEWYAFSEVPPFRPKKIFTDPRLAWAATYGSEGRIDPTLRRQGGFGVNNKGIADVKGNVWEWTSSCVVTVTGATHHCPAYFAAGEHEAKVPVFVRDPWAGGCATGTPPAHLGFRLVLDSPSKRIHPARPTVASGKKELFTLFLPHVAG
jgi:formylglycine-generating enzyme required for sulfatase activity